MQSTSQIYSSRILMSGTSYRKNQVDRDLPGHRGRMFGGPSRRAHKVGPIYSILFVRGVVDFSIWASRSRRCEHMADPIDPSL